jgi:quercetin dioxygenase-like cupin family protein
MTVSVTASAIAPEQAESALLGEGLRPERWSAAAGTPFPNHRHAHHKVLFCVAGSITFAVGDEHWRMAPGDRLDVPAATDHTALAGPDGVTCVEAYQTDPR